MIHIMVVEDESAILQGIVQLLESLRLNLKVVSSVTNGKAALEELEKTAVDVVVTDIRMPVMNGLQLIEESQKRYPHIEYVVLSGYSEFEYARSALRFGVGSYVLKPPKPSEIYEVFEKLCQKIEANKIIRNYKKIEEIIFSENFSPEPETIRFYENKSCYLLLACAGPYSPWAENTICPDTRLWNKEHIAAKMESRLSEDDICYIFDARMGNEKLIFLATKTDAIYLVKQLVNRLLRYEGLLGLPISIVLSERLHCVEKAREIYRVLRLSMGHGVVIGKSHMMMLDEKNQVKAYLAIDNNEKKDIENFIKNDDINSVIQIFGKLCTGWEKKKLSQANCEFSTKYLITEIFRSHHELKEEYTIEELLYKVETVIAGAVNFQQFRQGIEQIMEDLNQKIRGFKTNLKIDDVIELFDEAIRENYTKEISTEQFAKQFGYNPTYVANMFTTIKKISPNKLITRLRMQKAKELLTDTDYLLRDIATMTGYRDVSYFSRIFKEVEGESPKQYRDNYRDLLQQQKSED